MTNFLFFSLHTKKKIDYFFYKKLFIEILFSLQKKNKNKKKLH